MYDVLITLSFLIFSSRFRRSNGHSKDKTSILLTLGRKVIGIRFNTKQRHVSAKIVDNI